MGTSFIFVTNLLFFLFYISKYRHPDSETKTQHIYRNNPDMVTYNYFLWFNNEGEHDSPTCSLSVFTLEIFTLSISTL